MFHMPAVIGVQTKVPDTRAGALVRQLRAAHLQGHIVNVTLVDLYTIDKKLRPEELALIGGMLTNPVTEAVTFSFADMAPQVFNWVLEVGFLPGVTDNIATTTKEGIVDHLKTTFAKEEGVYTSQLIFIEGDASQKEVEEVGKVLANPLIQRITVRTPEEFLQQKEPIVPRVNLHERATADIVDLNVGEEALVEIGKKGIPSGDGTTRGPLALDLQAMRAIQAYFKEEGRMPTDVELESIAQTWSEHCKHTIFANPIDNDIPDGLYRTYIKGATNAIRAKKGADDFCISVFTDNSGGIVFDENYLVTHKVETHNSPSALDPFGGSITGIVGVNRDVLGFGLAAKPVINTYGFCCAPPNDTAVIYRDKGLTQPMFSPRRILEGVIAGVNVGGNCSGIPTPQGFVSFDHRYKGKPLVFVGTVGLIPRTLNGKPSHVKEAQPGDYIVMVGGRVGLDGIHGATFSSEALHTGSPATAVQIGDPITQKKMSDVLVKEARAQDLYSSITDNGAGGLSCSVAEMAKESGGCRVNLEKVPLKYPGLAPWQIWISESQERMTLSVPPAKWEAFQALMERRGVEATVIGEFTNSGRCVVHYNQEKVMDVAMEFLHDGVPVHELVTTYNPVEPHLLDLPKDTNQSSVLLDLLRRPNLASFSFISQQYDHEVQAGSVMKPLQGRGRVNGEVSITKPVPTSPKAVALSQGIVPTYSDIDTYHMAAAALDTAVRNLVAAGCNPEKIALLDNFCWCSSFEPERLGQLKRAVHACYNMAIAYDTPFISGKDSMFNDFKGFDEDGQPVTISIPPTLLISSISVMDDATKSISIDLKMAGDLVYIVGETKPELGATEYAGYLAEVTGQPSHGGAVPHVWAVENRSLYQQVYAAAQKGLLASSMSITKGGLAVALAKTSIAGELGLSISVSDIPHTTTALPELLFSESQGRFVVSINPVNKEQFEEILGDHSYACIGTVTAEPQMVIRDAENQIVIDASLASLQEAYQHQFKDY
jgi:phosphoribosylformylglycinamidine synthase II